MRFGLALFFAATAGLLALAAPTLARNADAPKPGEQPAASSCRAYQMAADGTWTPLPCQETGSTGQTPHKPIPKSTDDETR
jgi:hypothetical protein